MIQVTIVNRNQRQRLRLADESACFGRAPQSEGKSVIIMDEHVSREQFQIQATGDGKLSLENVGRQFITLSGGTKLNQGQSRTMPLPARFTVGQTVVEISALAEQEPIVEATQQPSSGGPGVAPFAAIRKIGKSYPYPLAFGFRLLTGITTPSELYKEQLRVAENIVAFVGSLALALLEDDQFQQLNEKLEGSALKCWQGGISPGDWLTLATHAINMLDVGMIGPLAEGLTNLQINKGARGFGKIMRDLIHAKNDYKHDRGPSIESEYRAASESASEMLLEAYGALAFLADYPIRLVQDVNPRRRGTDCDVVFLRCMGGHPGFETEQSVQSRTLRKGDLYIELEPDSLIPLYPFIHATTSSQTKSREFFFVDRTDQDRKTGDLVATLKSFDRGHTEQDADVGQEMKDIFG